MSICMWIKLTFVLLGGMHNGYTLTTTLTTTTLLFIPLWHVPDDQLSGYMALTTASSYAAMTTIARE